MIWSSRKRKAIDRIRQAMAGNFPRETNEEAWKWWAKNNDIHTIESVAGAMEHLDKKMKEVRSEHSG